VRAEQVAVVFALSALAASCASSERYTPDHPLRLVNRQCPAELREWWVEVHVSGLKGEKVLKGKHAAAEGWYPSRAEELGKEGAAVIGCYTVKDKPRHCDVLFEDPAFPNTPNFNFGAAAIKAYDKFGAPGDEHDSRWLFYRFTLVGKPCTEERRYVEPIITVIQSPPPAGASDK
jgi:hypothetical protein